jgi:hypothetical protein
MRENVNLVRHCGSRCEYYEVGCENNCHFELKEETVERPSLRGRRRNMKAEKTNAYAKAQQKLNSVEDKAAVTGYKKPKYSNIKGLKEQIEQMQDIHSKCKCCTKYPKPVFRARAEAIKQAKRKLCRQNKNK